MLEVDVTSAGAVRGVRTLRTTRPYTEALIAATKTWRFSPAEIEVEPPPPPGQPRFKAMDSTVLVTAVFLAPALIGPTLGDLPRDVGNESDSTPFPFSTTPPLFPPRARDAGLVMIETTIDTGGQPTANRFFDRARRSTRPRWPRFASGGFVRPASLDRRRRRSPTSSWGSGSPRWGDRRAG